MTNLAPAAGWHPDPEDPRMLRWWDGAGWTDHRQPAAHQPTATLVGGPMMQQTMPYPATASTSGLAVAALVTALLGLGLVPLVLGILALRSISKAPATAPRSGNALAIVGVVFGAIQLLMIPILLAVAIPTFLVQKDIAGGTQAKANVKVVVNAVEACAASNPDGSYRGCNDASGVAAQEPSLGPELEKGCDVAGGVCVEARDGDAGYTVSATAEQAGGDLMRFTETHRGDGAIEKECGPSGGPSCPNGVW